MPEPTANTTLELAPGRERNGVNPNAPIKKNVIDDTFKTDLQALVAAAAAVNVGGLITDHKTNKGVELARQQILPLADKVWVLIRKFKDEVADTATNYDNFRQECEDLLTSLRGFITATDPTWWVKWGKWSTLLLAIFGPVLRSIVTFYWFQSYINAHYTGTTFIP